MTDEDKAQRAAEQEIQAELERRWHEAETAERAGLYGWSLEHLYREVAEYARAQTMLVPTPVTEDLAQAS